MRHVNADVAAAAASMAPANIAKKKKDGRRKNEWSLPRSTRACAAAQRRARVATAAAAAASLRVAWQQPRRARQHQRSALPP